MQISPQKTLRYCKSASVAITAFIKDVRMGAYPSRRYLVDSDAKVVLQFRDWLAT